MECGLSTYWEGKEPGGTLKNGRVERRSQVMNNHEMVDQVKISNATLRSIILANKL